MCWERLGEGVQAPGQSVMAVDSSRTQPFEGELAVARQHAVFQLSPEFGQSPVCQTQI